MGAPLGADQHGTLSVPGPGAAMEYDKNAYRRGADVEHVHIFLSAVSAEFRRYREALRQGLDRPNITVKVQEDFIATGTETLDKLDDYIRQCDAVIHLVGDMTGAAAQPPSVAVIRQRYPDLVERLPPLEPFLEPQAPALSYTQWEAWLALYHPKRLIIATPEEAAPRDADYQRIEAQRAAQQAHPGTPGHHRAPSRNLLR